MTNSIVMNDIINVTVNNKMHNNTAMPKNNAHMPKQHNEQNKQEAQEPLVL